ncbi:MAG TPA: acyltransferase family protein [Usitatibacter sp.]|nr:acyltransferase family protein [Usitatibacter sp.]
MTGTAPRHAFGLDAVRALAVSSVLVAHGALFYTGTYPGARYFLIVFGVCGVEIFFALSGFLVGRQLLLVAEGRASAGRFLLRRWYRTLPNYYLFLALNAALAWWVLGNPGPDARFLVFAQSLAGPARNGFFPESWSLAVEEWFYLLGALAFAAAAWARLPARALGMILLAVVLLGPLGRLAMQWLAAVPMDAGVRKVSLVRLDALAFGLGCAWLERHRAGAFARLAGVPARTVAVALVAASVGLLLGWSRELAFFQPARSAGEQAMASLLFSALPLATALWLPWLARWESSRSPLAGAVHRLSAWSYALYLTHLPLLLVLLAKWPVANGDAVGLAARTAVWAAGAIALAAAVYRWYEHPLTELRPPLTAASAEGAAREK